MRIGILLRPVLINARNEPDSLELMVQQEEDVRCAGIEVSFTLRSSPTPVPQYPLQVLIVHITYLLQCSALNIGKIITAFVSPQ